MWFSLNIANFSHLFKRVYFDVIVDHLALMHIIKSKAELTTTRIKRQLEQIKSYSFNVYYLKGKEMILSDFLSIQKHDDSNPHEIRQAEHGIKSLSAVLMKHVTSLGQM